MLSEIVLHWFILKMLKLKKKKKEEGRKEGTEIKEGLTYWFVVDLDDDNNNDGKEEEKEEEEKEEEEKEKEEKEVDEKNVQNYDVDYQWADEEDGLK